MLLKVTYNMCASANNFWPKIKDAKRDGAEGRRRGRGGGLFQPQTGTPADLALPPENLKKLIFLCAIFFTEKITIYCKKNY